MNTTVSLTHKGWFGICPVYFGNLDRPAPLVIERHWSLLPLMLLSEGLFALTFLFASRFGDIEPAWPLTVTGELDPPKSIVVPDEPGGGAAA